VVTDCVGLPLGALFCFQFDLGLGGLWMGLCCGGLFRKSFCCRVFLLFCSFCTLMATAAEMTMYIASTPEASFFFSDTVVSNRRVHLLLHLAWDATGLGGGEQEGDQKLKAEAKAEALRILTY